MTMMVRIGGVDAGECDRPVNVGMWPSQVDDFKRRLATIAQNFDRSVDACTTMPANEKSAWYSFYFEFRNFILRPTPLFGSWQEWASTCSYAKTLDAWQVKIEGFNCNLIGPRDIKGADASVVKWGAAAIVATAVIAGLVVYGPSLAAGARSVANRLKR